MKFSKTVKPGDFVAKHGDKYVRAGRNRRIVGMYQSGTTQVILTDAGRQTVQTPAGIVVFGPVLASLR